MALLITYYEIITAILCKPSPKNQEPRTKNQEPRTKNPTHDRHVAETHYGRILIAELRTPDASSYVPLQFI
ncbi:hypothetical protein P692DRAFT_20828176 [Suillus brevipes Sb2]|nr:hypothetical protein P692DRAFT_20828176 [Suillus brevipes Sb2]